MSTIKQQQRLVKARCDGWKLIPDMPLAKKQLEYPMDLPMNGPFWVSRTTIKRPEEDDTRQKLFEAIRLLDETGKCGVDSRDDVPLRDVRLEWLGRRAGVDSETPEPSCTEKEKYYKLEREAKQQTLLHIHAGAFYVGTAASWRSAPMRIAAATGYRIAAPTYRLAPQNPFPGALLDVLVAYLALLSPPPGSWHQPIKAQNITLAADSAGANLCLALIQLLLTLRRRASNRRPATIKFHGQDVPLDLPAGLAVNCTYADLTDALPSWFRNGTYDILEIQKPPLLPGYPKDEIWPSDPPRGNYYTVSSALDHPLVSVCAARDWSGSPPMWFCAGSEERGLDGQNMLAARAHSQGAPVMWDEYEGMCHCWTSILAKLPQSSHCFRTWGEVLTQFTEKKSAVESRRRLIQMPDCKVKDLSIQDLAPLPFEEGLRRMRRKAEEHQPWTGRVTEAELKASLKASL